MDDECDVGPQRYGCRRYVYRPAACENITSGIKFFFRLPSGSSRTGNCTSLTLRTRPKSRAITFPHLFDTAPFPAVGKRIGNVHMLWKNRRAASRARGGVLFACALLLRTLLLRTLLPRALLARALLARATGHSERYYDRFGRAACFSSRMNAPPRTFTVAGSTPCVDVCCGCLFRVAGLYVRSACSPCMSVIARIYIARNLHAASARNLHCTASALHVHCIESARGSRFLTIIYVH